MADKTQHGARLLEELGFLHKSKGYSSETTTSRKNVLCNWKWKLLDYLEGIRMRRSRCVVCLQVHHISGLPPAMEGRVVILGWKTKGCKGEHTFPVHVNEGNANFDEIFLHYCGNNIVSILKRFTIWVSLVDAADCDLGTFHVDLSELAALENLNPRFGGKSMSFALGGIASGGTLSLSVYTRMIEENSHDLNGQKESKSKCFSCLPDLSCLRSRPVTVSARRVPSLRSDRGFITIENLIEDQLDDEDGDFITIEKGTISSKSRRPLSDGLVNTDDDDDESGGPEDEKPCLLMDLADEFDVEKVEDEFLRMLEEKYCKAEEAEQWRKGVEGGTLSLSLDLSLDLDLELLIKEAEIELTKATEMWKSRIGESLAEKEEREDLIKRQGANKENSSSGCSGKVRGFGSPI
ncbi:uncharacterized protein [Typha angustifolia]|uniref:uncharacterized protein n=1 Tax=Typha angustifolia TaxID=59011 RepID=UPI003C30B970